MRSFVIPSLLVALTACSTETGERSPRHPSNVGPLCSYVSLESSDAPVGDSLDTILLVAVYRLNEPGVPPTREPIELKFQVERSRMNELRGRLEAHPEVICRPDRDARYRVESTAFSDFSPRP
jgi:hypothetical protein